MSNAHVCTFLYELSSTDVKPPLSSFQHTENKVDDMLALCRTINDKLPETSQLSQGRLSEAFDTWYPKLQERMAGVPKLDAGENLSETRSEESKVDELLQE